MDYCENGCDTQTNALGLCLQCGHLNTGYGPDPDDDEPVCPDCGDLPAPGVFCDGGGGFHHGTDCECDWCLYS
ncbi:hypothetical protein [Glycomyces sp. MUSA5-2]|uniref:hypothetical protein n=1 Tax=Glycomyces sp. MUSA5-2 TaxID=2053002 RepID=UPI0030082AD1